MDTDQTIRVASSRTVGFADYGSSRDTAVIWCHGGPGSRLAPAYMAGAAVAAGLRLVGIDRPGYGLSTPEPGLDGSKILESAQGPPLPPSNLAMIASHPWGRHWMAAVPAMFAQGLAGATDDHLADGPGWVTFDVADITSPVIVLHCARDVICDPIHARHTAAIVPNAELRIIDDLGHLSIEDHIVPTITDILARDT